MIHVPGKDLLQVKKGTQVPLCISPAVMHPTTRGLGMAQRFREYLECHEYTCAYLPT